MPLDITTMSESVIYTTFALIVTNSVKDVIVPSRFCGLFSLFAGMFAGFVWAASKDLNMTSAIMQGAFSGFAASGLQSGTKALMSEPTDNQPL